MNAPINIQILKGPDGLPAFAVIPYNDYLTMTKQRPELTVPNEVVGKVIQDGVTPIRAWREHLGLTQAEVASRLGIAQSSYAVQESSAKLRKSSREKIAVALGVALEQLSL
ncbi:MULTISPECIES: helix-turn-helix domain-containing protein [unclassified Duganella]|uniref:helix-turn-helix domain-containing protein n=1 Tax=unclassified Duganella TaxID=2636909 RepID=UPI000E351A8F|nr:MULTISPECIES: helix-turn-helix transcriptional regulator [unclassified Duganella]RFP09491.1 XRE family transcriptional regulator [Duganella sp. BJB475]RFP27611.1 XRE family transcriptional regulator [Duganella sp. BJB476]